MWKSLLERFESSDSFISLTLGLAVALAIGMLAFNYVTHNQPQTTPQSAMTTQESTAQNQGQRQALPAKYKVQEGDTLWSIAADYYKSGYNFVDIQKANNLSDANLITVGQELNIPPAKPIIIENGQISAASTQRFVAKDKEYTVKPSDNLWTIADYEYGTGYQWAAIAKANSLTNPNRIYSGTRLMMP